MSYAPSSITGLIGTFSHAETGARFDYTEAKRYPLPGCEFEVWMSDGSTRTARILKTVAYVAIDEDENGQPVFEKWPLRAHHQY